MPQLAKFVNQALSSNNDCTVILSIPEQRDDNQCISKTLRVMYLRQEGVVLEQPAAPVSMSMVHDSYDRPFNWDLKGYWQTKSYKQR